jgi:ABC-2 type transport system ATP-binding protein
VDGPGVEDIERPNDIRMRFTLAGVPTPALRALVAAEVTAVSKREPTLERIFPRLLRRDRPM